MAYAAGSRQFHGEAQRGRAGVSACPPPSLVLVLGLLGVVGAFGRRLGGRLDGLVGAALPVRRVLGGRGVVGRGVVGRGDVGRGDVGRVGRVVEDTEALAT